jgi:hypothetical protein
MVKKFGKLAVALMAVGLLAISVRPAFAGTDHHPFKAKLSGSMAMTSQTTVSFVGSGTATSMGHITNVGNVAFTGSDSNCPGSITNVNTETLTDNHGDTLTIASLDVACPIGPGQVHGTGHWTVTGGTGRFSGTTGQGSADGIGDFNAGTFTMTLTGTLALPDA